ncbi:CaiB/BaiF CoA transferase family protein [Microvirga soli]|uniref:CaiB/BaiF CoA transferase family protein n=1 Tax=Microvirga soli TaxID=1854496 RepID=UPI00191CCC38|nr:CaiB/BaiF CoA-transferase family protein [Microvirga soli]
MKAPLAGIKVLDLTRVLAGPWCTMTLADLGAEVWKIEHPDRGDDTRHWVPPALKDVSTYYLTANRNKKSVALDLGSPEGQAVVHELARNADILVENFLPATAAKFGLDHRKLRETNPRLICCSVTGYGRDSDFAHRPGYDFVLQAECGFMAITGEAQGPPMRLGVAFIDLVTGMNAVQAILAALHVRAQTGQGQSIDIALWDSGLQFLANVASGYLNTGVEPGRYGNAHPSIVPYQTFLCGDGRFIALAVGNDEQYRRLCCDALQVLSLWEDERFRTNLGRTTNRDILVPVLAEIFRRETQSYWLEHLKKHNIPVGEVRTVGEALTSAEAHSRDAIVSVEDPLLGTIRMVRSPLRLSDTPPVSPVAPPRLGQHTEEVLRTVLGWSAEEISRLKVSGIATVNMINEPTPQPSQTS